MKRIIRPALLACILVMTMYFQSFALESIYDYTFEIKNPTFTEQSANKFNYYFVNNYDFKSITDNNLVDHFELTLNFSDYYTSEEWDAQVWIGTAPDGYSYGDPMNGFDTTLFKKLYDLDSNSLDIKFSFDNTASWFSQVVNNGIFTLALYESTQGKDNFTLNSAKLEIFGSAAPVPIPGAALLLGSGLLGVVALRKRRAA